MKPNKPQLTDYGLSTIHQIEFAKAAEERANKRLLIVIPSALVAFLIFAYVLFDGLNFGFLIFSIIFAVAPLMLIAWGHSYFKNRIPKIKEVHHYEEALVLYGQKLKAYEKSLALENKSDVEISSQINKSDIEQKPMEESGFVFAVIMFGFLFVIPLGGIYFGETDLPNWAWAILYIPISVLGFFMQIIPGFYIKKTLKSWGVYEEKADSVAWMIWIGFIFLYGVVMTVLFNL